MGLLAQACGQAVQDAVQEAVQEAIQQALEDNVRFDVRANFFTLIAITGVILFWRGIWSMWWGSVQLTPTSHWHCSD